MGDGFVGFAKPSRVVEADVGDHTGQWGDNVRGVEEAAHPGFPKHNVALLFGEMAQRHNHDHFEKRRRLPLWKRAHPIPKLGGQPRHGGLGDQLAVDLHPLPERHEMRRGKQPGA